MDCDQDGTAITEPADDDPGQLAANNFTVIYELPTAWMRRPRGAAERGVGTFRDVAAMLDPNLTAQTSTNSKPRRKAMRILRSSESMQSNYFPQRTATTSGSGDTALRI
jgi:hypothetical protein